MGILVAFRGDELKYLEEVKVFKREMEFLNFIKLSLVKPVYDRITASSIEKDDLYIGNLVVASGLRGKGIGTELLNNSFNWQMIRTVKEFC